MQYLIVGDSEGFKDTHIGDSSIYKTENHPSATYKGKYFVIEAWTFHISGFNWRRKNINLYQFEKKEYDRNVLNEQEDEEKL